MLGTLQNYWVLSLFQQLAAPEGNQSSGGAGSQIIEWLEVMENHLSNNLDEPPLQGTRCEGQSRVPGAWCTKSSELAHQGICTFSEIQDAVFWFGIRAV